MAYNFNGTSQRMSTTSTPVNQPPFTMACWFNVNDLVSTKGANFVAVVNPIGYSRYLLSAVKAPSPLYAYQIDGSNNVVGAASTENVSTGVWNHACSVFTGDSSRTVYLNGGNSSTDTASNSPTYSLITSIQIGAQYFQGSATSFTKGKIAEVGIWNAALTADEVASLAKGMTCDKVRPQSLVFYAPLVRDLQDVKGGLTITNNNAATVADHPRVYA